MVGRWPRTVLPGGRLADERQRESGRHLILGAASGETLLICRRNVPAAELRPVPKPRRTRRPVGLVPSLKVPRSFFKPLPSDIVRAFEGR